MQLPTDGEVINLYPPLHQSDESSASVSVTSLILQKEFKAYRLLYVPPSLKLKKKKILHGNYIEFTCSVWLSEVTVPFALYVFSRLVFITETECVYCAVRIGSLYIILRSAHTVYLCVLCGSENKQ